MTFERISIIGVGLIGGSLGLALRRTGFTGEIVGVSRNETIEQAVAMGVVDRGVDYDHLVDGVGAADLVIVCSPIQHIIDILPKVMVAVPAGALVTDAGSTKRRIVEAAKSTGRHDAFFVGGHPMAGSEKSGVQAADPFLFQNAIYILVPDDDVPEKLHHGLQELVRTIGARVLELSADTHDTVVAAISHLPQLLATCLVEMVGQLDESSDEKAFLPLAAGGFRDMTRIASSPFAPVWQDIYGTNPDRVRAMVDEYIKALAQRAAQVGDDGLATSFDYANRVRDGLPRDTKGFIHRLSEVLVVCEDKPGVIAEIATALAQEDVNINDIEVVKVREGMGGTLRLGFDSDEAAGGALRVLVRLGYEARRP